MRRPLIRLDAEDAPFAVAVERVGGDWIVVAGRSTEEVDATLGTVATLLAVSVPLVVGIVALTTWFAVGAIAGSPWSACAGRSSGCRHPICPRGSRSPPRATRSAGSRTR